MDAKEERSPKVGLVPITAVAPKVKVGGDVACSGVVDAKGLNASEVDPKEGSLPSTSNGIVEHVGCALECVESD